MKRPARLALSLAPCLTMLSPAALAQAGAVGADHLRWIDFDDDGRVDLHLSGCGRSDVLLRNDPSGRLEDVTRERGLEGLFDTRLALWEDVDRDGTLDLLALQGEAGRLRLFLGSDGPFQEAHGVLPEAVGAVLAAEFRDHDADGVPDLWLQGAAGEVRVLSGEGGLVFRPWTLVPGRPTGSPLPPVPASEPGLPAGPLQQQAPRRQPGSSDVTGDGDPREDVLGRGGRGVARIPATSGVPAGSGGAAARVGAALGPQKEVPGGALATCVSSVADAAGGPCLSASSVPLLGTLYPLSVAFNLDGAGRVGLGTLAPTHRLSVLAASADALRLEGPGVFGSQAELNFGDADYVYVREDVDDALELHGAARIALTGGNVGLGTLTPAWPLDVRAGQAVGRFTTTASTNGSVVELRNELPGAATLGAINFVDDQGQFPGQIAYTGSDALTFRVNGSERVRLTAAGRVGVGTTAPGRTLDVRGDALVFATGTAGLPALEASSTLGTGAKGGSFALSGVGLLGESSNVNGDAGATGVRGTCLGAGRGVHGEALGTSSSPSFRPTGALGAAHAPNGFGVVGKNDGTSATSDVVGVLGEAFNGSRSVGLLSNSDIKALGTKFFVQPHPSDPSRQVEFACLEGNERGTYCRGTATLVGGRARVALPAEFALVSEEEGLTVQLTACGDARLWVEGESRDALEVRGSADVRFHWLVQGLRRGFPAFEAVRPNRLYVPAVRGVAYGANLGDEQRRLLVENGTLNADFSPREDTAARLGWELLDPGDPRAAALVPPALLERAQALHGR